MVVILASGGWVLVASAAGGLIPMFIARSKGRKSLALWWLFGAVTLPVAIIASLLLEQEHHCPNCGANVRLSAVYCASCGKELPKRAVAVAPAPQPATASSMTPMQREVLRQRQKKAQLR